MDRRDKGNGSVFQRKDGRWVAQIELQGVKRSAYAKNEREARAKLKELQASAQRGTLRAPTHLTVSEFVEWWLETSKPRLKPTTHEWYSIILRTHVVPTLGSTKLEKLVPPQLTTLYSKKLGALSPQSVRHVHNCLRMVLNDAMRLDLIGANPCSKVDPPRVEHIEPTLWDEEELRQFVAHEQENPARWSRLWLTLLATGLRVGEGLGLAWDAIDFERSTLEVRQSIVYVGNRPLLSTPKSRAGRRVIALPDLAQQALYRQRAQLAQDKLPLRQDWPGGDFVFVSKTGHHPERGDLRKRLHEACARAGVPPIRVHDLRHLAASILVAGGADVKSVQKRLGHSTLQTTLGVYSHVLSRSDVELAATIDSALAATTR